MDITFRAEYQAEKRKYLVKSDPIQYKLKRDLTSTQKSYCRCYATSNLGRNQGCLRRSGELSEQEGSPHFLCGFRNCFTIFYTKQITSEISH